MKIILKELRLRNFKGAADQTVTFSEDTEINGANATGKTRLFDAWSWVLFGKDSEDRKDFSVKTLDRNNQPLHHADHTVTATLAIDGMDHTFERTLRERWVKKRGEETPEFDGNETLYFVNGVPHKQGEYQQKIEAIIPENIFKLLTNPFYFNQTMGWTQRRELLFKLTGGVTDQDLGERYPELKEFMASLQNKSLDDFRKEVGFKKKQLKQIIAGIPARMDEVQRSMQPEADYAKAEKEIARLEKEDRKIDEQLQNETEKNAARDRTALDLQREIFSLQQNILETRHRDQAEAEKKVNEARLKASALNLENATHEQNIAAAERMIAAADNRAKALAKENDSLREQWREANQAAIKFDEEEFLCPTCHRPFEAGDIEKKKAILVENFNRSKADRLRILTETGKANKMEIDLLQKDIEKWAGNAKTSRENIAINNATLGKIIIPDDYTVKPNPQIAKLEAQIKQKEQQLAAATDGKSNAELINQRKEISAAVDIQRAILLTREINQQHTDRLEQLHKEQKKLSQQLAGLEREEYLGEKLVRARVTLMEEKVNSLFTMVRFKMFSQQVNGGLDETCEALIDGVPFSDANNAAKINAGIDIINAFSKHYDIHAPIFIDNAEAVNRLLKTESQTIKLYVTKDKELKIVNKN
jgi:DNA repair protein SbcC/Rad50